jgi:alpha-tubulin suppressor-like RCC1 family protein
LSACGGPEAPEWLQTYQETGETTLDAAAAVDATAPVATDDVEEPGDATGDQDTPTPDATSEDVEADTGPECGPEEIACNGVDDDCDPMTPDHACEQPGDVTQYAACVEGACTTSPCEEGTQNQDQMAWVDEGVDHCEVTCIESDIACDGVDEDCDGVPDDDSMCLDQGPESVSRCAASCMTEPCDPNTFDIDGDASNSCEYACTKSAEEDTTCDDIDDDCDGEMDEDHADEEVTCGVGVCAQVVMKACVEGQLAPCEDGETSPVTPADDDSLCDGLDNDCDGETDEDYVAVETSCGAGACVHTMTPSCVGGVETECVPDADAALEDDTTCDGVDNDCDGETDEEVAALSCGEGACLQEGLPGCVEGVVQSCEGLETTGASDEVCNGVDDDCDGDTDEPFTDGTVTLTDLNGTEELVFGDVCGVSACTGGTVMCHSEDLTQLVCSTSEYATDETCDGLDDDCDGLADEDWPTKGDACDSDDDDSCASGLWNCTPNNLELFCDGDDADNAVELCDDIDNDCDEEVDEDFDLATDLTHCGACGHDCAADYAGTDVATWACQAGACAVDTCDPGYWDIDAIHTNGCEYDCTESGDETCDGQDNDCDGQVDEGFDLLTTPEQCGACGVDCATEHPDVSVVTWACDAGTCQVSICDLTTHDLNGDGDDGCEYACTMDGDETCDGTDEDCDGDTDEGELCVSEGADTLSSCVEASCQATACDLNTWDLDGLSATGCEYVCTVSGDGAADLGCDQVDDDCDGEIDEDGDAEGEPCPPADTEVVELLSNGSTYCALRQDGSVWCWASNSSGNSYIISYGTVGSSHYHTPQHIPLPGPVDDFMMESTVAMALVDGMVHVFGYGNYGLGGTGLQGGLVNVIIGIPGEPVFDDVIAMDINYLRACVLRGNSTLYCWGENSTYSPMGPGLDDSSAPGGNSYWAATPLTRTKGGEVVEDITDFCIGQYHGCVLTETAGDHESLCWGYGPATGTGDTAHDPEPDTVKGAFGLVLEVPLVDIACGTNHSCGLDADGQAYCWGKGGDGQLGYGSTTNTTIAYEVKATIVAANPPFVSLDLENNRSCGLTAEGERHCWGDLAEFGLGDMLYATLVPETDVKDTAGDCLLSTEGSVSCMGYNNVGQLGQGEVGAYDVKVVNPMVVEGVSASDVAFTSSQMCAIDAGDAPGEVRCWGGGNGAGNGGVGTPLDKDHALPILGEDESPIIATDIDASYSHLCAILSDTGVACWGTSTANMYGVTAGDGLHATRVYHGQTETPTTTDGLLEDVTHLEVSYNRACAIHGADKAVVCWGANSQHYGLVPQPGYAQPIPTEADGVFLTGAEGLALDAGASTAHACVILGTPEAEAGPQGEVWCWGSQVNGTLGDGVTDNTYRGWAEPVIDILTDEVLTGMKAIAISQQTTCAIVAEDGSMRCWGSNQNGMLGNNNIGGNAGYSKAAPIPNVAGVDAIKGGEYHFCVKIGEVVACWGLNQQSQIGPTSGGSSQPAPLAIQGLGSVTDVFPGYYSTCVTDASGNLICWGNNDKDYFGQGIYYSHDYLDVIGLDEAIPE